MAKMTMEVISAAVTMVVAINPRQSFCGGIMNFFGKQRYIRRRACPKNDDDDDDDTKVLCLGTYLT